MVSALFYNFCRNGKNAIILRETVFDDLPFRQNFYGKRFPYWWKVAGELKGYG